MDDNRTNLDILQHLLKRTGMRTVALTGGMEALAELRYASAAGDPFDAAIVDLKMDDMSGFEVAAAIRKLEAPLGAIPLLAYSSSSEGGTAKSLEAGFDGFLVKPAPREKLLEMLARLTGEKQEPVVEARASSIMTKHALREDARQAVRILLVEDNQINIKLVQHLLTSAGYRVEIALDGQQAVEIVTARHEAFDLVLMDVQMPKMDGFSATKAIRAGGFNDVPIIAMTANAMKGDREKCLKAGMNDYIPKPIRREHVFEVIEKWVLTVRENEF
ncbi:MAG: response regulator [Syntrophobacteraceae bacterium]